MRAGDATSAKQRASIAARLIKTAKPWPGPGLGRSFDSCFEMYDGAEVKRLLIEKAAKDPDLREAMGRHPSELGPWLAEAEAMARGVA